MTKRRPPEITGTYGGSAGEMVPPSRRADPVGKNASPVNPRPTKERIRPDFPCPAGDARPPEPVGNKAGCRRAPPPGEGAPRPWAGGAFDLNQGARGNTLQPGGQRNRASASGMESLPSQPRWDRYRPKNHQSPNERPRKLEVFAAEPTPCFFRIG